MNHDASRGCGDFPFADLGVEHHGGSGGRVLGADIFDAGGKVANLVKSIPYRHVEGANAATLRQTDTYVSQMTGRIGQRNKVLGGLRRLIVWSAAGDRGGGPGIPGKYSDSG